VFFILVFGYLVFGVLVFGIWCLVFGVLVFGVWGLGFEVLGLRFGVIKNQIPNENRTPNLKPETPVCFKP
jgi:hypothetical protein